MNLPAFGFDIIQEEFIESIIIFVYEHLSKWQDRLKLSYDESEPNLNANLSKYLNFNAREREFHFSHEEPQGKKRFVDFAACYCNTEHYDESITVFECKCLSATLPKDRKDEYVTGHKKTTGGIQRFKLEAHGKEHEIVGMIGYVQTGSCSEWRETINNCIDDLCCKPDENGLYWTEDEYLNIVEYDKIKNKLYSKSIHPRITKPDITIHHLWVNMQETV